MELLLGGFLMIIVIATIRIFAGSLDHDRLRDYVEQRGGRVESISWAPFGPGWFGGNKDRCYLIHFFDFEHNRHEAYARTSMWSGVYFTEDRIVYHAKPERDEQRIASLENENARLRAEIDKLKGGHDRGSDAIQE